MWHPPLVVQPIMQVGAVDCAVASLAMYLGQPYRKISEVAMAVAPSVHKRGLWATEMVEIAKRVGVSLVSRRIRTSALEDVTAILCVRKGQQEHAVMLFQGVVMNPADGQVWDLETWLTTHKWAVTGVLTADRD